MSENDKNSKKQSVVGSKIRSYFMAGILITAPLAITLYLTWVVVSFIDGYVDEILPYEYNPETYLPFEIPGIGLLIMFVFLTAVGALTAGLFGRLWLFIVESIMTRMPIIRSIYTGLKQIFETVFSDSNKSFKEVVLVEYPRKDMWVLGFLTGEAYSEIQTLAKDVVMNVFIPTTPNPTSGFLLFVPKNDIIVMKMSVEDALKLIISGGIVFPGDKTEAPVDHPVNDETNQIEDKK